MTTFRRGLRPVIYAGVLLSMFAPASQAQGTHNEDMLRHFQMNMIDTNKDSIVSKKEFMDTMSRVWDLQMSEISRSAADDLNKTANARLRDRMTIEQYRAFATMLGLSVGN